MEAIKVLRRAARLNNAILPPEEELLKTMSDIELKVRYLA